MEIQWKSATVTYGRAHLAAVCAPLKTMVRSADGSATFSRRSAFIAAFAAAPPGALAASRSHTPWGQSRPLARRWVCWVRRIPVCVRAQQQTGGNVGELPLGREPGRSLSLSFAVRMLSGDPPSPNKNEINNLLVGELPTWPQNKCGQAKRGNWPKERPLF